MEIPRIKVRCSSLGRIMTKGKVPGDLSAGAKTYCEDAAKQFVYGYSSIGDKTTEIKTMKKGLIVEPESIALVNSVYFENFQKNTERRENDWITGMPDIVTDDAIWDLKSSWSIATFPARPQDGEDSGYEWQLRGYKWLYEKPHSFLAYCLVDTPGELCEYEDSSLHYVSHIAPELRVTRLHFERDEKAEMLIRQKVEAAQIYFEFVVRDILNNHT